MAEPGDAVRIDDVEQSSSSESDEEDSSEDSTSSSSSSSDDDDEEESDEEKEEDESSDSDASDIWDTNVQLLQSEEATEANLQADYKRAVRLIVDGESKEARRILYTILEHPLLAVYKVDLVSFDWSAARSLSEENGHRVPPMARLFSSVHFHLARFEIGVECLKHLLQALTVFPKEEFLWNRLGESSMQYGDWSMALFAFGKCDSLWSATHGTVVALYKADLHLQCLEKIAEILELDRYYVAGLVLKEEIRNKNEFWEEQCRRIFKEDTSELRDKPYDRPIPEEVRREVLSEIGNVGKDAPPPEVMTVRKTVVDLSDCTSLADVGVYVCDIYDRVEWLGNFVFDKVCLKGFQPMDEACAVVSDVVNEIVDCVCVLHDMLDSLEIPKSPPEVVFSATEADALKKRKSLKLGTELSRRSTRFQAEFNIDDEHVADFERTQIATLLEECCALECTVVPLVSARAPLRSRTVSSEEPTVRFFVETESSVRACVNYMCLECDRAEGQTLSVFDAAFRYLSWMAENCSRERLAKYTCEVYVECYRRWICDTGASAESGWVDDGSCSGKVVWSPGRLRRIRIHLMAAELGCEEALFTCFGLISPTLPAELGARIHWAVALNGANTFPPEMCRNHLYNVVELTGQREFRSLIWNHEVVSSAFANSLIEDIDRRESITAVHGLFQGRHFEKVIRILEESFHWEDAERSVVLSSALTLIDACLEVGNVDKASVWICRLLDFTKGFRGTDDGLQRLHRIDLKTLELQNVSNVVHCVVPLLTNCYKSDVALWLLLYRAAQILEGDLTREALVNFYATSSSSMLNSSLNVLVAAHDAMAETIGCGAENYRVPVFALREFARVKALPVVNEVFADGMHSEQLKGFLDEVHQCTFCVFGCPTRRKRQLEEHGGGHNYEPCADDAESILSLLLPERVHQHDGPVAVDLIELLQKKFVSFTHSTPEEDAKLAELDAFIERSVVGDDWPRCAVRSSLRGEIFYEMALNSFRSQRLEETVRCAKLFLISANATAQRGTLFYAWTLLALAGTSTLFSLDEEDLMDRYESRIFPFRMALFFDPRDHQVTFNLGNALYQIRCKLARFQRKLCMEDLRGRVASRRADRLLLESRVHFSRCLTLLSDGDEDKWECHYFLAKIAEKDCEPISKVFYHYYEAAHQLVAAGVQYPLRVNTKKQDNVEAIELHYRAYACLVKWLVEAEDRVWSLRELHEMYAFAVCFGNHGVCRKEVDNTFHVGPEVRAVLEDIVSEVSRRDGGEVTRCVDDLAECVALRQKIIELCREGFRVCTQRFPHFKSYYRLAQLALEVDGDVKAAAEILFTNLLLKKKANVNVDNVFENLITVSRRDLDRGDSQQFHVCRVASLAVDIAARMSDVPYLITLVHTISTLHFCQNFDYLTKDDLVLMYRRSLNELVKCIKRKLDSGEADTLLLFSVYDLYQYASRSNSYSGVCIRNGEKKLSQRLQPWLRATGNALGVFSPVSDPVEVCKQLLAAQRQKLGKRRSKRSAVELPPAKVFHSSSEDGFPGFGI